MALLFTVLSTSAAVPVPWTMVKDGNGDPIPDSPRGILPLGDGDGGKFIPTGMDLVEKWSP